MARSGHINNIGLFVTFMWCVIMPFAWANNLSKSININFVDSLPLYKPELVTATLTATFIVAHFFKQKWASYGLGLTAMLLPVLKFTYGSPTYGSWLISSFLLALMAWRLYGTNNKSA